MIALRHVTKRFGGRVALDDVSLAVEPGATHVLLGSSGGQRQRVSLMRALMLDPPVLLLDEPLGALDPITRASLQAQLGRVFGELRKAVILVTHDVREAFVFGSVITLLSHGRVVQQGTLTDLAQRPADPFVTEFLRAQAPPPEMARELRL